MTPALWCFGIFFVLLFVAYIILDIRSNRLNREVGELKVEFRKDQVATDFRREDHERRIDTLTKRANDQFTRITGLSKEHASVKQYVEHVAKGLPQPSERMAQTAINAKVVEIYTALVRKGTFTVDKPPRSRARKPKKGK
jgi:hypothetical protein